MDISKYISSMEENEMILRYLTFMTKNNISRSFRSNPNSSSSSSESSEDSDREDSDHCFSLPMCRSSQSGRHITKPLRLREDAGSIFPISKTELDEKINNTLKKKKKKRKRKEQTESFTCSLEMCRMVIKYKKSYEKHVKDHKDLSRLFVCDVCTMRFLSAKSMRRHQLIKHSSLAKKLLLCQAVCVSLFDCSVDPDIQKPDDP